MRRFLRLRTASAVSSTYSTEGGRTIGRFHIRDAHKRRGDILPARLRFSARRGTSLVELMISMLILAIVCVAWLTIFQVQSANRESYRREAVERLAGLMDIVSREGNLAINYTAGTAWKFDWRQGMEKLPSTKEVVLFTNSTIGYRLRVKKLSDVVKLGWISDESIDTSESPLEAGCLKNGSSVLVGELFERSGVLKDEDYADSQRCVDVSGADLNRFWRVVVILRLDNRMN